jgi:hypothetical protein
MGNNDSPKFLATLFQSLSPQTTNRSGLEAFVQLCNSARVAAQQASFTSVANSLRNLYRNDTVNWGQVVFLITCVITMAGCGIFSSFRRRSAKKPRSQRTSIRKTLSKSSSKTLTSSDDDYEDEEYDSNGSLRHAILPSRVAEGNPCQPKKKTCDGKSKFLSCPRDHA